MKIGKTYFIHKNMLDKACFQYDKPDGDFKDLKERTQWNKVLRNKAFEVASNVSSHQLANERSNQIIRKFKRRKA